IRAAACCRIDEGSPTPAVPASPDGGVGSNDAIRSVGWLEEGDGLVPIRTLFHVARGFPFSLLPAHAVILPSPKPRGGSEQAVVLRRSGRDSCAGAADGATAAPGGGWTSGARRRPSHAWIGSPPAGRRAGDPRPPGGRRGRAGSGRDPDRGGRAQLPGEPAQQRAA